MKPDNDLGHVGLFFCGVIEHWEPGAVNWIVRSVPLLKSASSRRPSPRQNSLVRFRSETEMVITSSFRSVCPTRVSAVLESVLLSVDPQTLLHGVALVPDVHVERR
jgi:hypothetical protein